MQFALASSLLVLLCASFTKIDVIVRTEGRIIPSGKSQIVQHLEGGIVKPSWFVKVMSFGQPAFG